MHATMMTESVIPFKVFRIYIQNKVQNCMPREYSRQVSFKRMSWRFVISTAVGQLIDSVTFVTVAFTGRLPLREMFEVSLTGWTIMVTWEIAALPVTVPLVKALKRIENVDYFDIDTDFNPLHLRTLRTTPEDAETSPALSRQQIP